MCFLRGEIGDREFKNNLWTILTSDRRDNFTEIELKALVQLGVIKKESRGYSLPIDGYYLSDDGQFVNSNIYNEVKVKLSANGTVSLDDLL
jgi:hypothetical protein